MTLKRFKAIKIVLAIIVGVAFSEGIVLGNHLIPLAIFIIVLAVMFYLRGKVKEIVADERDYEVGGKAARWALQIYSWLAVAAMLIFFSQKAVNPAFEPIAFTLAYSTCLLMILYVAFFYYHQRVKFFDKKIVYVVLGILFIFLVSLFGLRLLSGEDDWLCQNGEWVRHGQPSFPAPTVECK